MKNECENCNQVSNSGVSNYFCSNCSIYSHNNVNLL